MDEAKRWGISVASVLFAAVLFVQVAAFNRTPLLFFGDSIGYLKAAMTNGFEPHSYVYSIFLRYTAMGYSSWITVAAQALLLAFSMRFFLKGCFDHSSRQRSVLLVGASAVLTLASPASKLAGRLTPDVFASICFFLFMGTLYGKHRMSSVERGVGGLLLVVLFFTHTSHWMVFTVLVLVLAARNLLFDRVGDLRTKLAPVALFAAVLPAAVVVQFGIHRAHRPEYQFSPGSHVMLAAVFSETGALGDYLWDHCEERPYALCETFDYTHYDSGKFLWAFDESPLYAAYTGEDNRKMLSWDNSKEDLQEINRGILMSPGTYPALAFRGVKNAVIGLNRVYHHESDFQPKSPRWRSYNGLLENHLPYDTGNFARIQQGNPGFARFDSQIHLLYRMLLTGSIVGFVGLVSTRRLKPPMQRTLSDVLVFLLCNAVICGAFSGIASRYNERTVWLLAFLALVAAYDLVLPRLEALERDATPRSG